MADLLIDVQSAPATPAAGQAVIFVDTTAKILCLKDDTGLVRARTTNAAITNQAPAAATDTYITNSDLLIPAFGLQAKTNFLWQISCSKTGAGAAAPIYVIRIGTNRTTADAARLTLTGPLQTAIADIGTLNILLTVRNIGASGVLQGTAWWDHRGTAISSTIGVGFANDGTGHVEGTAAGFDMTALAGSFVGLSINTGAAAAWTITQCLSDVDW